MPEKPSDLVQGTLDMLILKTLGLEPTHGYGISVRIEQMSKSVFRLNAGSLFLATQRLERDGLIEGEWKPSTTSCRRRDDRDSITNRENGEGKWRQSAEF
jgi:PadR family transcriptional regulator PadR